MAARNEEKLAATLDEVRRDVPGANVRPLILDLADLKSVRSAAEEASTFGPLNILVNNAGVMATPYERTVDGLELQMATNVFGHFALTGLLLPRLAEAGEAGGARVVSVASQGHRLARRAPLQDPKTEHHSYSKWMTYAQTKLSNLLFTFELDRRTHAAGLPVDALAAHPGFAATGLMASGQRRNVAGRILDAAFGALGQAPAEGALPLLMAATADLPSTTYVGPGGPGEMRGAPKVVGTTKLGPRPRGRAAAVADRRGRHRGGLPMRALLLENVHPLATRCSAKPASRSRAQAGAMDEDELVDALDGVDLLGIRSKTEVTEKVLAARPDLVAVGAFCIGTNQIDLDAASTSRGRRLQRAVLQHPLGRRARGRRDHRDGAPAHREATRRCTTACGTSRRRAATRSAAARSASSATATSARSSRWSPRRSACRCTSTTPTTSSRSATRAAARRSTSCSTSPRRSRCTSTAGRQRRHLRRRAVRADAAAVAVPQPLARLRRRLRRAARRSLVSGHIAGAAVDVFPVGAEGAAASRSSRRCVACPT